MNTSLPTRIACRDNPDQSVRRNDQYCRYALSGHKRDGIVHRCTGVDLMAFFFRTEPIHSVHMYFYLSLRRVGQLCSSKSFAMERGSLRSIVRCDDGTSRNLAIVEEAVSLVRSIQRKVFDQHLDFSCLGQTNHFHKLGYRAPKG